MFGILLYDILFFGIPIVLIGLFLVSLYRYRTAKEQNKQTPGTFSEKEMQKRKTFMLVLAAVAVVLAAVVVGFVVLLFMAVAFM